MRNSKEISELTERHHNQSTKMTFPSVKAFMHHESEDANEFDKIEIAWDNGQYIENTVVDLGDHCGFELSVFCHSDMNYDKIAVLEIESNVGEPTAQSMPVSEIETPDEEGYDDEPRKGSSEYAILEDKVKEQREVLNDIVNLLGHLNIALCENNIEDAKYRLRDIIKKAKNGKG